MSKYETVVSVEYISWLLCSVLKKYPLCHYISLIQSPRRLSVMPSNNWVGKRCGTKITNLPQMLNRFLPPPKIYTFCGLQNRSPQHNPLPASPDSERYWTSALIISNYPPLGFNLLIENLETFFRLSAKETICDTKRWLSVGKMWYQNHQFSPKCLPDVYLPHPPPPTRTYNLCAL